VKGVASEKSGDDTLTGGATYSETTGTFGAREVDSGDFEQPPLTFRRFLARFIAREERTTVLFLLLLMVLLLRLLFLLLVVTVVVQVVVVFKKLLLC